MEGTALRVTAEELVVDPAVGSPVAIRLVPGIPITVDDRVSAWTEIEEGARVRVAFAVPEGRAVAVRVEAHSSPGAPPDRSPAPPPAR